MPIAPNTTFDHYEILAPLGKGGMGEVLRAKDTRLDREVAIKVLPAEFALDADRLRRFEQEARATSALNHPNILTVYDFGTHEGNPYLVMELLEGEELRASLDEGTLPMRKAIEYAQQIAAGLAAAHEKGIVHRDLKPENLFVTKDGRVKILDFGLAKLTERRGEKAKGRLGEDEATLALSPHPAVAPSLTIPGTVMGTVAYMSPEQVQGKDVDHRSDIFSFGIILHEMLSGQRVFTGESQVEVMHAILKQDPPELSETNAKISLQLEKIVRRCLEKKPEQRFHSAHDLGFALSTLTTPSGSRLETAMALPALTESLPATGLAGVFSNARLWMAMTAVMLLGLLLALPFAVKYLRQAPLTDATPVRFTIAAPEKVNRLMSPEISPDGRNLVFSTEAGLWLRPLDSLTAQPLPGTEESTPAFFWSPDSRSICFGTRDGKLKKLDLAGGTPQVLGGLELASGARIGTGSGAWNREGVILFTAAGRIYRVPATGGQPTLVLGSGQPTQNRTGREATYRSPVFLPDGRHFLLLRLSNQQGQQGAGEIHLATLDSKETTRLLAADSQALYATFQGRGYLLFARGEALLAQPFDASTQKLTGEPFVVADKVAVSNQGKGIFSVSDNGILVFNSSSDLNYQLNWVDRTGKPLEPVGAPVPSRLDSPRLSPDGKQVAVVREDAQTKTSDIYVIDLARGVSSRLTFDPDEDRFPIWSRDGSHIAWQAYRDGAWQIYQKLASGIGPEELLLKSEARIIPDSWSPDGRYLIYTRGDPKTKSDLWVLPLTGEHKPFLFLQTPFEERGGRLSPDGRWIAYESDDQGRYEISVQPFPASGGKWQISMTGGIHPRWRADGKELYYISNDNKLMAVEVKSGSGFEAGMPKMLFDLALLRVSNGPFSSGYSVSADGQRFLFVTQGQEVANLQYTVVVNWQAEAKK